MARGLRNKLERRNKRVKRVRYGKKELARLVKTVKNNQDDVIVRDAAEVIKNMGSVKNKKPLEDEMEVAEVAEEVAGKAKEVKLKKTTGRALRSVIKEHGTVPKWIHPRKTKKVNKMMKRVKRQKRFQQTFKSKPKK